MSRLSLRLVLLAAALSLAAADLPSPLRTAPAAGIRIAAQDRERLELGSAQLAKQLESLRTRGTSDARIRELLPDVEIFHKAVDWALRYDEFFRSNEVAQADQLIRLGTTRAQQLADGRPDWLTSTGLVVRGYRSKIDGSVQPYGLVVPATLAGNTNRPRRLDVWLHGRDDKLTELKFISDRLRSYGEFTPSDTLVLHPYGRFCNAFKFAGETDVFEAMDHARKFYPVDPNRLAIRGFSMGGAGTWHLAAHHPGVWAAAAPGAGFAETAEYTGALTKNPKPPWYEQKLWHLYDATDYALNLFNVPTIAYSGEIDKQKQAADVMARAMKAEGLELQHIIGPGVAHKYEPGAKKELARRFDEAMAQGRESFPTRVTLVTWTLRYNRVAWLVVDRLRKHWEQARVRADLWEGTKLEVTTTNVEALSFDFSGSPFFGLPDLMVLDGVRFHLPSALKSSSFGKVGAIRSNAAWVVRQAPEAPTRGTTSGLLPGDGAYINLSISDSQDPVLKAPMLQGPIDDAFMDSFVVVPPTKQPVNAKVGAWASTELARFTNEWRAQFRGDARVIDASQDEVARAANSGAHLVLWGDPASNPVLAQLLPKLPIQWDAKELRLGTNRFDAATHVPVLIFPNPLNPSRYIVLNSGPTFLDFGAASNAQQTPKLPDYAVLDITVPRAERLTRGVTLAGFFDENWQLAAESGPPSR